MFDLAYQIKRAITDIAVSILKSDSAPMSSATHLNQAIARLSALTPDWHSQDREIAAVVEDALTEMRLLRGLEPGTKLPDPDPVLAWWSQALTPHKPVAVFRRGRSLPIGINWIDPVLYCSIPGLTGKA